MGTDLAGAPRIVVLTSLSDDPPLQSEMPSYSTTIRDFFLDTIDVTDSGFPQCSQC